METAASRRLLLVWLGLSALSLLQLWLGSVDPGKSLEPNVAVTVVVLGTAMIKVRLIFREFMEVRHAPRLLRRLTDGWIAVTSTVLLGVYLAGSVLN